MRLGAQPACLDPASKAASVLRQRDRSPSGIGIATSSTTSTASSSRPHGMLSPGAESRRLAGRNRRVARASVVRGRAVPSRVQVAADAAASAVCRLRRRGGAASVGSAAEVSICRESEKKIIVDEDWKSQVEREREAEKNEPAATDSGQPPPDVALPPASLTYLATTLYFQAMTAPGSCPTRPPASPSNHCRWRSISSTCWRSCSRRPRAIARRRTTRRSRIDAPSIADGDTCRIEVLRSCRKRPHPARGGNGRRVVRRKPIPGDLQSLPSDAR